jgi:hypothetical protein
MDAGRYAPDVIVDDPALRSSLLTSLPAGWTLEGPALAYTGYGACLRARSTDPRAPYADLAGIKVWAPDVSSVYSRLAAALAGPRARTRRRSSPADSYTTWRAEPYLSGKLPAGVDEKKLRAAWEKARSALPPGWQMADIEQTLHPEATGSYRQRLRWAALASTPYMYLDSDTHYVHRAGWGTDPVSAFEDLAAVLGSIKAADFVG